MTIGFDKLPSVIESLYLGIPLGPTRLSDVLVNPDPMISDYLYHRTIIINKFGYPESAIRKYMKLNTIVFRINYDIFFDEPSNSNLKFSPYLERYNPSFQWSGEWVDYIDQRNSDEINFSCNDTQVFYPKARTSKDLQDQSGNMSYLGLLLYQVGSWNPGKSKYQDLDISKTEKGVF